MTKSSSIQAQWRVNMVSDQHDTIDSKIGPVKVSSKFGTKSKMFSKQRKLIGQRRMC